MARILLFQRNTSGTCRNAQRQPDTDSHTPQAPNDDPNDEENALSFPEAWRPFIVWPEAKLTSS